MYKFINYKNQEYDLMNMTDEELKNIEYDIIKDKDEAEKIIDQMLGIE